MCKECYLDIVKICKNVKILKYSSVKNDLGAANFKRNKITQNGTSFRKELGRPEKSITDQNHDISGGRVQKY